MEKVDWLTKTSSISAKASKGILLVLRHTAREGAGAGASLGQASLLPSSHLLAPAIRVPYSVTFPPSTSDSFSISRMDSYSGSHSEAPDSARARGKALAVAGALEDTIPLFSVSASSALFYQDCN